MSTKTLRQSALSLRTRVDLKRFLHETCELTLAEASAKVRELVMSKDDAGSAKSEELTRTGLARVFKDMREQEQTKLRALYCRVMMNGKAHEETLAYRGPERENEWVGDEFGGEKTLMGGFGLIRHEIAVRMAQELKAELDTAADEGDDALEAKLVRLDWPDDEIGWYMGRFSKGVGVLTSSKSD